MMEIDDILRIKKEYGLTVPQISQRSGVPMGTLSKIFSGKTAHPRRAALSAIEEALSDPAFLRQGKTAAYLVQKEDGTGPYRLGSLLSYDTGVYDLTPKEVLRVAQPAVSPTGNVPGSYTLQDYRAMPEDTRSELIDGTMITMEAPTVLHQALVTELVVRIRNHIRSGKGSCRVLPSPIDVVLDNRNVLQPDIAVVCRREQIRDKIYGAPDLVIEVVSPSSRKKDCQIKYLKYAQSGVREYWIVDPVRKTVVVYDFAHEDSIYLYGFGDAVPVGIWNGDCVIDMAEIYDSVRDLNEEDRIDGGK